MSSQGKTYHLRTRLFSQSPKCLSHSLGFFLYKLRGKLRQDPDHKSCGVWSWCRSRCDHVSKGHCVPHCAGPGVFGWHLYQANFVTKASSEKTKSTCWHGFLSVPASKKGQWSLCFLWGFLRIRCGGAHTLHWLVLVKKPNSTTLSLKMEFQILQWRTEKILPS